jgi:hypothetical protein
METRKSILADVIPAAGKVFYEWSELLNIFSGNEMVENSLNLLPAHFLARLHWNSLDIIRTAFAVSPLGRAEIRMKEHGYTTSGEILPVTEPKFVERMQIQFSRLAWTLGIDEPS